MTGPRPSAEFPAGDPARDLPAAVELIRRVAGEQHPYDTVLLGMAADVLDATTMCPDCDGTGEVHESGHYVPGEQFVEPPSGPDMCGPCRGTGRRATTPGDDRGRELARALDDLGRLVERIDSGTTTIDVSFATRVARARLDVARYVAAPAETEAEDGGAFIASGLRLGAGDAREAARVRPLTAAGGALTKAAEAMDAAARAIESRPSPPAQGPAETEDGERRCPAFHPEYGFTCPFLPADHGGPAHFDPAGGWWDREHGQVRARLAATPPAPEGVSEAQVRAAYETRYPLSIDTESDVRELLVSLDVLRTLGMVVSPAPAGPKAEGAGETAGGGA